MVVKPEVRVYNSSGSELLIRDTNRGAGRRFVRVTAPPHGPRTTIQCSRVAQNRGEAVSMAISLLRPLTAPFERSVAVINAGGRFTNVRSSVIPELWPPAASSPPGVRAANAARRRGEGRVGGSDTEGVKCCCRRESCTRTPGRVGPTPRRPGVKLLVLFILEFDSTLSARTSECAGLLG